MSNQDFFDYLEQLNTKDEVHDPNWQDDDVKYWGSALNVQNKKCDKDCFLCVGSRTNCTHCNLGRELFFDKHHNETRCRDIEYHHLENNTNATNATECKRDHYFDLKDAECRECADQCVTCSGHKKNCTSCSFGYDKVMDERHG